MIDLKDYESGNFPNVKLKGAIGLSDLFKIDQKTKHDAEIITVSIGDKSFHVEVYKALGDKILQVCAKHEVERYGFGNIDLFDEININRIAISQYCKNNNLQISCELQSWSITRCILRTAYSTM